MKVIATAGHVDHGKSRLILELTGINPDRLQEEQDREMTIDLGFAWMELPSGESVGIIDVPGHRDFIDNMLTGVGAIDAALLVIAADEGIMPQTIEHLAILDLLEVKRGVVALSKHDLIEDEEWLMLVQEEIRSLLATTSLATAPIVPVSAVTGYGLDELVDRLEEVLIGVEPRRNLERPRLPIDRVFTMSGFGTIVTGTLIDGTFTVGQEVVVLPGEHKCRIRGLQTHKTKIEEAVPGSRVAANLSGIEVSQLSRGDVVTAPGAYTATRKLAVRYRHLPDVTTNLRHNMKLKMFIGAAQREARVRLLACDEIMPGDEGWLQLILEKPVVVARGDRYILRRPSPGATLGGGVIVEPHSARLRRRYDEQAVRKLEQLLKGTVGDILAQSLDEAGPVTLKEALEHAQLEKASEAKAIAELKASEELIVLTNEHRNDAPSMDALVMSRGAWIRTIERLSRILEAFHKENPLRTGMPREELNTRMGFTNKTFQSIVKRAVQEGLISETGGRIALPDHEMVLSRGQKADAEKLLQSFVNSPYSTPSVKECIQRVGGNVFQYLLEGEILIQLTQDVVFRTEDYNNMVNTIREEIERIGSITIGQVRDMFQTSRKYALALMEHLDSIGVTVRDGDERKLAR